MILPRILLVGAVASMLSGCVAAAIPALAAGSIGSAQLRGTARDKPAAAPVQAVAAKPLPDIAVREAAPVAALPAPIDSPLAQPSDEALLAAASPYWPFAQFARAAGAQRGAGKGVSAMVLPEGVNLSSPAFTSCGDRPMAAIVDLDPPGAALSLSAAPLTPDPGLAAALAPLRDGGIPVLWLSGAAQGDSAAITTRLTELNLFAPDDRLLLRGAEAGDRKQLIRQRAASRYCIVAIAGDEKADFDELFAYLREPAGSTMLDMLWGNGWFLVPTPLAPDL